ncbi:MAG TPA: acetyl-CoA C-acetyltransferase [Balneola sp.]|jgi:acetyl-CoA C-acetyltransferase|nr:acetyl-CoA C-acyltransferase [Balneola sp.]MAO78878.1 acetyl-CoA C-acyltransferase [Balneola sp.]MBF63537.1 acetyl-CoA C-acyltransferase [Balneola sp.]HBZ39532.1 acetyl-CoA C-acetyltransferase [Balneola sp.]|tara:strand:- start:3891 stop:5069 length:1179 start_codon:yes stop_codon:yes gene_type:complete
MRDVVIVEAKRTPIGSFGGSLASFTAPELGSTAIIELLKSSGIPADVVQEVVMGNVLTAGIGQAPARQAALKAGLSQKTPSTTVNKVCASGMKAIMMAADQIRLGDADVVVAGGMESMSNVPYYLPKQRYGSKYGHVQTEDGILKDGLWDVYNDFAMGNAAEICAKECSISREEQDEFAIESYKRAQEAQEKGYFDNELISIKITDRRGNVTIVDKDEEVSRVNFEKIPNLRPVFDKEGTVTAANASSINDGAAAVLVMSAEKAAELGLKPLAKILSHANAAKAPEWFTTAPSDAIPIALKKAGLTTNEIDLFEINEAFSVVSIANNQILELDPEKVNINGGAVSIGHPIGCSGARIVVTLLHALKRTGGKYGCAGICNGGGGASALVIEMI